ncbi:MAG: outer membrane beta-barrel protein [Phycisphaeraceae bacterium]
MRHVWVFMLAALIAAPAFAQEDVSAFGPEKGDWQLTLGGAGSNDNDFDTGDFSVNGTLGYFYTDEWKVSLRQSASWNGGEGVEDQDNYETLIAANYFFDMGRWQPFVGGNIGYIYGDNVDDTWAAGPEAGVHYYALEDTFVFGRVAYEFYFDEADDADDAFDDGEFLYTLGIGFNF